MPQYSRAMELVQEDLEVRTARQPLDILLNKYGLRLNPASIWLEVGEDGRLVLTAVVRPHPAFVAANAISLTLTATGSTPARLHFLRFLLCRTCYCC